MKRILFFLFAGLASAQTATDRWWEMRLASQPAGYFEESTRGLEGGRTVTTEHMLFVINRLGNKVEVSSRTETTESAAGVFESQHSETSSSQQVTRFDSRLTGDGIELRTETGGKSYSRTLPVSGSLAGPKGVEKLSAQSLKAPGNQISFQMFVPDFGHVVRFHRTVTGIEPHKLKVEEEMEGIPGKQILWLDSSGKLLSKQLTMPFGEVTLTPSNREIALLSAAGGELPGEAYDRTMARSNIRLPDPRSISYIKVRLKHRRPDLGWPSFEGGNQRIIEKTRDEVVLEVRRPEPPAANAAPSKDQEYLTPNAVLQSDDPEVSRIAHQVAGTETAPFAVARKLQQWTSKNLAFDLGIALTPASEVVRNRRGTCVAYAVLLASLERAAGIPSRVAMGLVYLDGIWGGHAWTEVLAGGHWIPVDSAMYSPGPADAARIQFGSSSLEDNMTSLAGAGLQIYGNVDISTLEYTLGGRSVRVPADARPHSIEGDVYRNPWLGFSFRKPDAFRFTNLDAVFPHSTVLAIEGPDSRKLDVSQELVGVDAARSLQRQFDELETAGSEKDFSLAGRKGRMLSSPAKSRVVVVDGGTMWVLTAEGKDANRLLEQVAAEWKWIE